MSNSMFHTDNIIDENNELQTERKHNISHNERIVGINSNNNTFNLMYPGEDDHGDKTGEKMFAPIAKNLRTRSNRRAYPVKVRQKRQTMQNMTKPLKQWLCKNRYNPYPSKLEKEILASESQMSLTQVANWFANARRRLKNTVKGDYYDWATRVKLYNTHVDGNAELLSIGSDDSNLDSDDNTEVGQQIFSLPRLEENGGDPEVNSEPMADKEVVPSRSHTPTSNPSFSGSYDYDGFIHQRSSFEHGSQNKFKQTILQRYLSDQTGQTHRFDMELSAFNKTRSRRPSGSMGSRDYEEMSTSSGVSMNDYHLSVLDESGDDLEATARRRRISGDTRKSCLGGCQTELRTEHHVASYYMKSMNNQQDDMRWKEISAAMALTSLARSRKYPVT